MKEEALKLADKLDLIAKMIAIGDRIKWGQDSELMENGSAMIRRLVEELDKQCKPINHYEPTAWINHIKQTGGDFYELNVSGRGEPLYRHPPQTKPLSDEEIEEVIRKHWNKEYKNRGMMAFARAIEERHWIK